LYKIVMALLNILLDRRPTIDPVTRWMSLALALFDLRIDAAFWSQQIAFFFVLIVIASSLRGFLLNLLKVLRKFSASSTSYDSLLLFVSHVTGMYFFSFTLLMRMSLPAQHRELITQVLGDLEFHYFHRWNDYIFVPSCIVSALILPLARTARRHSACPARSAQIALLRRRCFGRLWLDNGKGAHSKC
jgi:hypothetical protein